VRVTAGQTCVSQRQLLVGDVIINEATRKKKRMHIRRLKVWKLRETNVRQEFAQVAATQVEADKLSLHFNGDFEVDLC